MKKLLSIFSVGAIALAGFFMLAAANTAFAAGYMKLGDIKGESTDREHKDWIMIESVSGSLPSSGSSPMASGRSGRGSLTVTKAMDKASPLLQEAAVRGKSFPKVEIHMRASDTGASRATYLKYELENVTVTSYQTSAGSAGDSVPMEQFSLNFGQVKMTGAGAEEKGKEKPERPDR